MAELTKKIRARNGHKLVVKNTIAKVYGLLPPAGRVADIEVQTKLESYKNTLERKRKDIETLDADIINALEKDDDIEKDILDREEFEEEVSETICRIQNILKARTESPHRINWESQSRKEAQVKLPKLNMLTFNGDPTQWISFSESFKSSIDGNQNLAKVEKMKYLQGLLSGPAAETIKGLSLSEENYDEAFELLKRRFGNKQIIISKHIENIMEMPKVTSLFELKKLRLLFDKTETAVRSLRSIGIPIESYGTVLSPVIMSKIPNELRLIISRKTSDVWELDDILNYFGEELTLREQCSFSSIDSNSARFSSREQTYRNTQSQPTTSSTLIASSTQFNNNDERNTPKCLFCDNRHYSASCSTVTDPNVRKRILRDRRRCFICLKPNHISKNCHSSTRCYRCKSRHHSSICGAMEERPQSPSRPSTEPQSKENTQQQQESVTTNLFTLQNVKSNVVLLQTAKTIAHPVNNPQDFKNVRVILDSCSQRSYITTELRDKLKLPTISSHEILIKEFGNETGTLNKCDLVNLALKSKDGGSITISAFVVKTICSPVSSQAIDVAKNMYSHLKGLILADSGSGAEDVEIDVLIGADYVYTVMLDKVVRGEHSNSPVATATRFGYVLNGPVQLPGNTIVSSNIISSHVLKSSVIIYNDEVLSNQVKQFWDIESVGIKTKAEIPESYDDDILKDKVSFNGKFVQNVLDSLYVDDYVSSFRTDEECFEKYRQLKKCFSEAGFNMRKWASNSNKLLDRIKSQESNSVNAVCDDETIKVLGISWNCEKDNLIFDLSIFKESQKEQTVTKRLVLSTLSRFYDPLGLSSPVILSLKQLFQEVCKLKISWDAPLPKDCVDIWNSIISSNLNNSNIVVERSVFGDIKYDTVKSIQLHGFSDASQVAYGAAVYLRIETFSTVSVKLIASKTCIAPIKGTTIPRLELMGALTLAELINTVITVLKHKLTIGRIYCWSDSQVALHWILNENKVLKQQFVRNRVIQIRAMTPNATWGYCPTSDNPADVASRGSTVAKLQTNQLWWEGAPFLKLDFECWPKVDLFSTSIMEEVIEKPQSTLVNSNIAHFAVSKVIACQDFSSIDRLFRVTALVLQFIEILMKKDIIPAELYTKAQVIWYKELQTSFINNESFNKSKENLHIIRDSQNIIRVGANTFIRALQRFIGRRGIPAFVISDNGSTFIDRKVQNYVKSRYIEWKFNVPTASWWGGVFESLVKLTKRCLRKTLGNAKLSHEELETVLIETEGILNSRPLTFVYNDISQPPLTPSCLIVGRRLLNKPAISEQYSASNHKTLVKRSRHLQFLLSQFFNQWKTEYLTSLRERASRVSSKSSLRVPRQGEIVSIAKDKIPRQRWAMGKITKVFHGKDNIIRAVELKTSDSAGKSIIIKRPIQRLYPLEVDVEENKQDEKSSEQDMPIKFVADEDVSEFICNDK
eukprot:gene4439-5032_t